MVEANMQVERAEFDAITRRLLARAAGGRGRVRRIPSADAEDVVQDAWEKKVRQKRGLHEVENLEAHVQQALVDTSRDYWRRERRKGQIPRGALRPLDAEVEERVASEESEETWLGVLRAREIRRALHEETDEEVERFAILETLDFSEKEIADQLGLEPREAGAIRKRFARARPALREALGQAPDTQKEET
jgi:DNA-directed RNA polymerase specialized sigma24 family protein